MALYRDDRRKLLDRKLIELLLYVKQQFPLSLQAQ